MRRSVFFRAKASSMARCRKAAYALQKRDYKSGIGKNCKSHKRRKEKTSEESAKKAEKNFRRIRKRGCKEIRKEPANEVPEKSPTKAP